MTVLKNHVENLFLNTYCLLLLFTAAYDLIDEQTARDSLEQQLHALKDESANTLQAVLIRLQGIEAQAQRSQRQLVEQRHFHSQVCARSSALGCISLSFMRGTYAERIL